MSRSHNSKRQKFTDRHIGTPNAVAHWAALEGSLIAAIAVCTPLCKPTAHKSVAAEIHDQAYLNCQSRNVIYLLICPCPRIYVCQTNQEVWQRIQQHISNIGKAKGNLEKGHLNFKISTYHNTLVNIPTLDTLIYSSLIGIWCIPLSLFDCLDSANTSSLLLTPTWKPIHSVVISINYQQKFQDNIF
ncbi:unnamed protein product [Ranitomeya imitator]|uniref:GIY-YIG domain-containing protein n=1 Tax=Ranitomeya imitator TaxID=111125 RepID=A0ABN9LDK1_9NEOB|nr:unnamed protein product [Ranitomeya imitator]